MASTPSPRVLAHGAHPPDRCRAGATQSTDRGRFLEIAPGPFVLGGFGAHQVSTVFANVDHQCVVPCPRAFRAPPGQEPPTRKLGVV